MAKFQIFVIKEKQGRDISFFLILSVYIQLQNLNFDHFRFLLLTKSVVSWVKFSLCPITIAGMNMKKARSEGWRCRTHGPGTGVFYVTVQPLVFHESTMNAKAFSARQVYISTC